MEVKYAYCIVIALIYSCSQSQMNRDDLNEKISLVQDHEKYENGSLKSLIFFNSDSSSGKNLIFYKSGELYSVEELDSRGSQCNSLRVYHKNGVLKAYGFYDAGKLVYKANYDENGKYIGDEGTALYSIGLNTERVEYGQEYDLDIKMVKVPKRILKLYFTTRDSTLKVINQKLISNGQEEFSYKFMVENTDARYFGLNLEKSDSNSTIIEIEEWEYEIRGNL